MFIITIVVYNLVLAAPPTALVPNCNDTAVPLDLSATWRGGDMLHGQQHVLQITLPRLASNHIITHLHPQPGEDTPALAAASTQYEEQQLPVISHYSTGVTVRCQGWLPMVGGVLGYHTTQLSPILKLGSLQPVRSCPTMVCHHHWVHADLEPSEQQIATIAQGNKADKTQHLPPEKYSLYPGHILERQSVQRCGPVLCWPSQNVHSVQAVQTPLTGLCPPHEPWSHPKRHPLWRAGRPRM